MKRIILSLFFIIPATTSAISTISCSAKKQNNFENEVEMLDIGDIEKSIREPKPKELAKDYFNEIIETFRNWSNEVFYQTHYEIISTNKENYFSVNDEIYIRTIKDNNKIYGKIINKIVNHISLSRFQSDLELVKPLPGDEKNNFEKNLILELKNSIPAAQHEVDFKVIYDMAQNSVFSKGDLITIQSIPDSEIIKGAAILQINIFDINLINFESIKPLINEKHSIINDRVEKKINEHVFGAKINQDYKIEYSTSFEILKEGDKVKIIVDPESRFLIGDDIIFTISTFNIKELNETISKLDLDFNTNVKIYENNLEAQILDIVPYAKRGIDYIISNSSEFEFFIPGNKINLSVIESSNYLIGDSLEFVVPKVNLSKLNEEFRKIQVTPGVTEYKYFEEQFLLVLETFSPILDITDELIVSKNNLENTIYADSSISITPRENSYFFNNDLNEIVINFEFIDSEELNNFIMPALNLSAGMSNQLTKKIIKDLLSSNEKYSSLSEHLDYEIIWNSDTEFLKIGESVILKPIINSRLLKGKEIEWYPAEFGLSSIRLEIEKLNINNKNSNLENYKILNQFLIDNIPFMKENLDYTIEWFDWYEAEFENWNKQFVITFKKGQWIKNEEVIFIKIK
ncbi:hypothetical protein [Spiroplasma alleghenense]|uniref:Lipoprotein n=1 Tax=Spiroplasma alleghenense TaxID=216931 RepID=A0A345Z4P0_9MOLU|nr:hypothetical protein [Spiroplasma alleghenense]AXK51569.1 hypothetical protein SALLE_v1c08990 [Spiroplasma alleghenense]